MNTTAISIQDMHCGACHNKIRQTLKNLVGISRLQFNPVRRQLLVTHSDALSPAQLLSQIEQSGFQPALLGHSQSGQPTHAEDRHMLKRLGIAGLAMMQVMMLQISLYAGAFQGIQEEIARLLEFAALFFCIPVVSYCAVPFFRQATRGWRTAGVPGFRFSVNMDTPIVLAITIAFSASVINTWSGQGDTYYDSVAMFTFLMLGARYIDQRLRGRLQLQDSLTAALPTQVVRLQNETRQQVALNDVIIGDVLWIEQGAQIPVDGKIQQNALLDEALLSGEAGWVQRQAGELAFAGTYNRGAGFAMTVNTLPAQTRLAHIDRLADQALTSKNSLARLADRVAQIFIPAILLLAALTCISWLFYAPDRAIAATLAVLVVSCPCALSLATPAALTAALIKLRQMGILVKNPRALEINHLSQVFIDKTGTLTEPETAISAVRPLAGWSAEQCLQLAAGLQMYSSHPLANAFKAQQPDTQPELQDVEVLSSGVQGTLVTGQPVTTAPLKLVIGSAELCGINTDAAAGDHRHQQPEQQPDQQPETSATVAPGNDRTGIPQAGDKEVYLTINSTPAAVFYLRNPLRADAQAFVQGCKARGMHTTILSGDNPQQVQNLAGQLGLQAISESQPEDKTATLQAAKRSDNSATLYVGDGLNDLPALATADVSIAMLETSDLVKSKADVNLLTPRLTAIMDFVDVSIRCQQLIRQNLYWAFAYNAAAIPLAALGYAPPWVAALGMSGSSLLVMLNACRLLGAATDISPLDARAIPATGISSATEPRSI